MKRSGRASARSVGSIAAFVVATTLALATPEPGVRVELAQTEATVGDRIAVTATIVGERSCEPLPQAPSGEWGPFQVDDLGWSAPEAGAEGADWTWSGTLVAFRTGELELPPRDWICGGPDGETILVSEPVPIRIASVLEPEEGEAEIADIKDPVSMPRELKPLWIALGILVGLALLAGLLAWLHRRYARSLAAAEIPEDPFHRVAPHEWVYRAMRELLERRLAEQGEIDRFYEELSSILKRYLGGRYRLDLMERTSSEVVELLDQAGAPFRAVESTRSVLTEADGAKFARQWPGPDRWRASVEAVYAVVDATRPAEIAPTSDDAATEGAA